MWTHQFDLNYTNQWFKSKVKRVLRDQYIQQWSSETESKEIYYDRRFPEITGEDNLTVFSYSGRVKSPERRWQQRRADLRHFEIFRHGPIIIYTRLPAGGTYYPICTFPASSECLIGISDAFSAFCLRVSVIFPTCSLYPQQKRAYSALHPQAWTYIYRSMPEGSYRVQSPGFPKIVYYRMFKNVFAPEDYLQILPLNLAHTFVHFRTLNQ